MTLGDIIKDIKKGRYEKEVSILRTYLSNGEKEKYDSNKKRLPGVTFCANFSDKRKKDKIKKYHNLIVLDIDKLDKKKLDFTLSTLEKDPYVFTYWISPSNMGIKGLVSLNYEFDIQKYGIDNSHKHAFSELAHYFVEKYSIELDLSGSDTTRLCFLSSDHKLVFKTKIHPFLVKENVLKQHLPFSDSNSEDKVAFSDSVKAKEIGSDSVDILKNPKGKNNYKNKQSIIKVIKYLNKNKQSITSSYEDWYRVAYAIANSFTYDVGEKFFLSICELDGSSHDETQSKNMLLYCYQNSMGSINFNTLMFMAKNKGFKI